MSNRTCSRIQKLNAAVGWNTKLSARETNYGTRIDYILITKGLVSWVKAADVQQDVKGSDHCPVFVDFHDEITTSDGSVVQLRDSLGARNPDSAPPRLATKFWDEYSGKQTRLHNFFAKKATESSKTGPNAPTPDEGSLPSASLDDTPEVATQSSSQSLPSPADQPSQATLDLLVDDPALISQPSPITPTSSVPSMTSTTSDSAPDRPQKRKLVLETPLEKVKKQKGKKVQKSESSESTSQTKLSSFFAKPKAAVEPETEPQGASNATKKGKEPSLVDIIDVDDCPVDVNLVKDNIPDAEDGEHYPSPSQSFSSQATSSSYGTQSNMNNGNDGNRSGNGKDAWSAILAPTPIPRCTAHNEPAKEHTVNKPGPNKGKRFFICSR